MGRIGSFIVMFLFGLCILARSIFSPQPQTPKDITATNTYLPLVQKSQVMEVTPGTALWKPLYRQTATPLEDGKILLIGGSEAENRFVADVVLFDPATGQYLPLAPLHTARHDHTATLLADGRVLVVGGYALGWLADAEIYDPAADTWTVVPPLYPHGTAHTATRMQDGRVLVAGGCIGGGVCTHRMEIFDPQTNAWAEAMPLALDRWGHTAQLLENGLVLVAGGATADGKISGGGTALLYDPENNEWIPTGPMIQSRILAQSVRLPDGRILVAGGIPSWTELDPLMMPTTQVEIYDPASNAWQPMPSLNQPRIFHHLLLLPTGQILAASGARAWDADWSDSSFVPEIELYDPLLAQWEVIGTLPQPSANATGVLLQDGRVWLAGGHTQDAVFSGTWLITLR